MHGNTISSFSFILSNNTVNIDFFINGISADNIKTISSLTFSNAVIMPAKGDWCSYLSIIIGIPK